MKGLNEYLTTPSPEGSEKLTPEKLDEIMRDLMDKVERNTFSEYAPLTKEQWAVIKERGVALVGNKFVFTMESKERCQRAVEEDTDEAWDALNDYELLALEMLNRQAERRERDND